MTLILVTGSRLWTDRDLLGDQLAAVAAGVQDRPGKRLALMQGCASGADTIARSFADAWGWMVLDRPVLPEDWRQRGPIAGYERNAAMVHECVGYQTAGSRVVVAAFTAPCPARPCRNRLCRGWTHGTDHCGQLAAAEGLSGWWIRPDGAREPLGTPR